MPAAATLQSRAASKQQKIKVEQQREACSMSSAEVQATCTRPECMLQPAEHSHALLHKRNTEATPRKSVLSSISCRIWEASTYVVVSRAKLAKIPRPSAPSSTKAQCEFRGCFSCSGGHCLVDFGEMAELECRK